MRDESGQYPDPVSRCGTAPDLVDELKLVEQRLLAMMDGIEREQRDRVEPHGHSIARAHFELGFMELYRALTDEEQAESGFVIERGDSDPDQPLYYAPEGCHGALWSHDVDDALRLSREIDASRLAMALGAECRVSECLWGAP